jgi:hypothetical protein
VAVVTRCSLPAHLKVLDLRHGLPDLPVAEVVLTRSRDSAGSRAADALYTHTLPMRCATRCVTDQRWPVCCSLDLPGEEHAP